MYLAEAGHSYRQISLFGSTIRSWSNNASEMKKLAARDFEDLLQVFLCSEILWYVINDELLVQHSCVRRLTRRAFQLSSDESSLSRSGVARIRKNAHAYRLHPYPPRRDYKRAWKAHAQI